VIVRIAVIALWLSLGLGGAAAQQGRHATPVFEFDSAEFVMDPSPSPEGNLSDLAFGPSYPPGPDAPWRHVPLPDDWFISHPGVSGIGWYHMTFDIPSEEPYVGQSFYMPRGSSRLSTLFVNGVLATSTYIQGDARAMNWDEPMRFSMAPTLLHRGQNDLYIRVSAVADLRQGLSRVYLGPSGKVLVPYFRRWVVVVDSLRLFGGAAAIAGILALAFWFRIRTDKVMFWFGVTALGWALMAIPAFGPRYGNQGWLAQAVVFPMRFAYAAPLLVACLRLGGARARIAEPLLWAFTLAGAVAMPLSGEETQALIITTWSTVYLTALIVLLVWLIATRVQGRTLSFWLLIAATVVAIVLNLHDYGRWMGWLDYDNPTLAHFHVPFVLAAIGVTIIGHQVRAIDAVARANRELEARIAEKTREIEASFQHLREAENERALAVERRRIMADMHDGIGGSLLGVLSMIRVHAEWPRIERRVREAMLELRMAIDSLEPVDGDLGVVLGNVRHRMRETIEESGVRLLWRVGEVPAVDYLTPRAILAIQRIVLEALTNALRHARAGTIEVRTDVDAAEGRLRILVRDDGTGFDPATVRRGRGLDSVAARARGIGATVEYASDHSGTSLALTLPLTADDGQPTTLDSRVTAASPVIASEAKQSP
jgi:signal transduction histidine kinase